MVNLNNYKLPIKNLTECVVHNYVTAEDFKKGDTAGTTETDSKTAPKSGGYTRIYS